MTRLNAGVGQSSAAVIQAMRVVSWNGQGMWCSHDGQILKPARVVQRLVDSSHAHVGVVPGHGSMQGHGGRAMSRACGGRVAHSTAFGSMMDRRWRTGEKWRREGSHRTCVHCQVQAHSISKSSALSHDRHALAAFTLTSAPYCRLCCPVQTRRCSCTNSIRSLPRRCLLGRRPHPAIARLTAAADIRLDHRLAYTVELAILEGEAAPDSKQTPTSVQPTARHTTLHLAAAHCSTHHRPPSACRPNAA
jgi:hypothetical protein